MSHRQWDRGHRQQGDMKLSGAVDTSESWNATQGDLDKSEKWIHRSLTVHKQKLSYSLVP